MLLSEYLASWLGRVQKEPPKSLSDVKTYHNELHSAISESREDDLIVKTSYSEYVRKIHQRI